MTKITRDRQKMKRILIAALIAMTVSNFAMAQVAQKLGVTTYAERSTVFCLLNCKSEVDKCVEAKIVQECASLFPNVKNPEKFNIMGDKEFLSCGEWVSKSMGGRIREECLKAASGKN
jgi:hypothetical protein